MSSSLLTPPTPRPSTPWLAATIGVVVFACALACSPSGDGGVWEPEPDIPATVEYDTVKIEYEEEVLEAMEQRLRQQAMVGDMSEMAQITRGTADSMNLSVSRVFRLIEEIKKLRPTSFDNDAGFWEWETPEGSEDYVRLVINKRDPASIQDPMILEAFDYQLFFGVSAQDNRLIYDGDFANFGGERATQQGMGIVRIYFDDLRRYDPDVPYGVMRMAFRSNGSVRQVRIGLFRSFAFSAREKLNALYEYTDLPDGTGRMNYIARENITGDQRKELLSISAAWTPEASGYASVRATEGSIPIEEVVYNECWDELGVTTYVEATPDEFAREGGSLQDCPMQLRDLSLDAQVYVEPEEEDPALPDAHPAELE